MNIGGWNGSAEDHLHGDEEWLDDDEYAPMAKWEIDEALADIKRKEEQEKDDQINRYYGRKTDVEVLDEHKVNGEAMVQGVM